MGGGNPETSEGFVSRGWVGGAAQRNLSSFSLVHTIQNNGTNPALTTSYKLEGARSTKLRFFRVDKQTERPKEWRPRPDPYSWRQPSQRRHPSAAGMQTQS